MLLNRFSCISVFVVAGLLWQPSVYGKGKKKAVKAKEAVAEKTDETASTDEVTSASIRNEKVGGLEVLYTPVSDFMLSYGGHVVFNAGSSWQFGLTYLTGSEDAKSKIDNSGTAKVTRADLSGQAIYLDTRFFIGNSFSILFGIGQRSAKVSYRIEDSTFNYFVDGNLDIESIVIPLFVGNHWTWESGFTVGCDWIGAMIPVSGKAKATTTGNLGNTYVKLVNDEFVSLGEKLAKQTSLTLALTSVGFVF